MKKNELEKKTVSQLRKIAEKNKVKGWSNLNKSQIVNALTKKKTVTASKAVKKAKPALAKKKPVQRPKIVKKVKPALAKRKSNIKMPVSRASASGTPIHTHEEEQKIGQSKYYVGPSTHHGNRESDFVFPESYGQDKIVLMVRDPNWMHVYWEITEQKISSLKSSHGDNAIDSSRYVLRVLDINKTTPDAPNSFFDVEVSRGADSWYINVPNQNCSYCIDLGFLTSEGEFVLLVRSNAVKTPRVGVSEVLDDQWMSFADADYDKIYALSGGLSIGMSSGDLGKAMQEKLESIASSDMISSGAVSSFSKKEEKKRGFFLVVDTELIVYGVTVPDAELTIQGVPKKLNPDGTFSARFSLPDGNQVIPVKAISSDKIDEITITPIVKKDTEYKDNKNGHKD